MPEDDTPEEPILKDATQSGSYDENTGMANAVSRIAQEAKQGLSFGSRGVREITKEFTTASNQLEAGQLVKDEFFTLFEAVGALEIMDPKMDSGYVAPNDTFEADFDLSAGLDAAEGVWIMDQLLSLEITWYDGYPLSQTVFTSLHIDRLLSPDQDSSYSFYDKSVRRTELTPEQELVHVVLRAYCIALIKCCHLALHLIQSQNFYEEEDFVTHLFGRELLPTLGATEALRVLDNALSRVAEVNLPKDIRDALMARLELRHRYLKTLADESDHWQDLVQDLDLIETSHDLAQPIPAAFSEKVQRQLATSTPPRPMLQISWDLACSKWTRLFEDTIAAHRLTSSTIIQTPACLQRAVWAFSYRGEPCALARAALQDILFGNNQAIADEIPHYDLLLTDIRELVLAGDTLADPESFQVEVTSDPRHICSRLIEGFMDKAIDEYLNLYRMVCQNRCRIRRTFTQAIPILDALESEAMKTDLELAKVMASSGVKVDKYRRKESLDPLTSWTKFYKLRIIAWTIQLGFETDIYLPDELWYMYAFLAQISTQQSRLIEKILFSTTERTKSASNQAVVKECRASIEWLNSANILTQITNSLALALWSFYTLLMEVGVISSPKRDFAETELLYEARMKPFLGVTNDRIMSLDDFQDRNPQNETVEQMCHGINEPIKMVKALITSVKKLTPEQAKYVGTEEEWKKEIKQLETTCVAIAVAASQFSRAHEKYGEDGLRDAITCVPEKKYHLWWIVPQLKEKRK